MAAGSIPDITPYFTETYKEGQAAARLQIQADLERELARERAASQMAQTLVGGAFSVGGQLGSAALAHYLREPLEATKAGAYDFKRAYGKDARESYLDAIEPQLQLAAEKRAAAEIGPQLSKPGIEQLRMPDAGEFGAVTKGLVITEGGETLNVGMQEAAKQRHLARMKAVVRAGGSVSAELKELDLGVPEFQQFKQDPTAFGIRPTSAKAAQYYAVSEQINRKKQLETMELLWKRGERVDKIKQKALVDTHKLVADTDLSNMSPSGLAARGFPTFKFMAASELAAQNGIVAVNHRVTVDGKVRTIKRLYLQRQIGGELVMLRDPLNDTQMQWLRDDIAFAVAAPLTGEEHNRARKMLQQFAIPLKKAGRMSINIYNKQRKERNKEDPVVFRYSTGTKDTPMAAIDVRYEDIATSLMSRHTKIIEGEQVDMGSKVERMMTWLRLPKNESMEIAGITLQGAGIKNMAQLQNIEMMLTAISEGTGSPESRMQFATKLFGRRAPAKLRTGLRLLVRETTEGIRGKSIKTLGGVGVGKVTPGVAAKRTKLSSKYTAIFSKGVTAIGKTSKTADNTLLAAMKIARRSKGNKPVKITAGGKVYNFTVNNWKGYDPDNKDIATAKQLLQTRAKVGLRNFRELQHDLKRAAVLKHFKGHIQSWKDAAGQQGLSYDDALEVFRNNFPDQKLVSDDDFETFWRGGDPSAGAARQRTPIASMDDDRATKAIKAIAQMDISDKEKNRRFVHFLSRMGA